MKKLILFSIFLTLSFPAIVSPKSLQSKEDKCFNYLSDSGKSFIWKNFTDLVTEQKKKLNVNSEIYVSGHGVKLLSSTINTHVCSVSFTVTYTNKIAKFYDILFKTNSRGEFLSMYESDIIVVDIAPEKIPEANEQKQEQQQEGSHH